MAGLLTLCFFSGCLSLPEAPAVPNTAFPVTPEAYRQNVGVPGLLKGRVTVRRGRDQFSGLGIVAVGENRFRFMGYNEFGGRVFDLSGDGGAVESRISGGFPLMMSAEELSALWLGFGRILTDGSWIYLLDPRGQMILSIKKEPSGGAEELLVLSYQTGWEIRFQILSRRPLGGFRF